MKAIQYSKLGGPEVLEYAEVPKPSPKSNEILIRVLATSINHIDIHFRKGLPGVTSPLPHIPGSDAVGVIDEIGKGVKGLSVGETIVMDPSTSCGQCEFCKKGMINYCPKAGIIGRETNGADAEFMVLPAENAMRMPTGFDPIITAAAPLVYLTAWSMVVTKANLQKDQTILIMGAGSGVGTAAIQIAKMIGATVFTTAGSDDKVEKSKKLLHVDEAFNYSKIEIDQEIKKLTHKKGVDVIIDHVGGKLWQPLLRSLKNGGTLVTCGATDGFDPKEDLRHIFYRQLRVLGSTMGNREEMKIVMSHIFEGRLQPVIDRVYDLETHLKPTGILKIEKFSEKSFYNPKGIAFTGRIR